MAGQPRSSCDSKACLEVRRALLRARAAVQLERSRLQAELDALGAQLLAHQSQGAPFESELAALLAENEELSSRRAQLLRRQESLRSEKAGKTHEAEELTRRRELLDGERLRWEKRVEEAREESLDVLWNRRSERRELLAALPPAELVFAARKGARRATGASRRGADAALRYLGAAEARLVDVCELRLLGAGPSTSEPAAEGPPSRLSPVKRSPKCFRLSSRSAGGAGVFRGYTPSGSYTVPFRESPHWIPAGRSLEHGAGEVFASLHESSLSSDGGLAPIHFDARARSRWGREHAVGRVRLAEDRDRRTLSSAPGRLQLPGLRSVSEDGFP